MAAKKKVAVKKAKTAKPIPKKAVLKAAPKKAPAKKPLINKAKAQKAPAKKVAAKKPAPAKKVLAKKPSRPAPAPKKPVKLAESPKKPPLSKAKPAPKAPSKPEIKPVVQATKTAKSPIKKPAPSSPRQSIVGPVEIAPYQPGVDEEYMSGEQLEHFRLILNQWKGQLMQEVDSTVGHMKEEAILYPDPLDRAAQEEGFNLELRTRDRERRLIKKIEMSLDKIDNGEYGFCQSCGTDIGLRRLEARPTADKCIDCKTFEEIREKQSGL